MCQRLQAYISARSMFFHEKWFSFPFRNMPLTAVSNLQPWHVSDTGFEEDTFHFFHENIEKNRRSILVLGFSQVLKDTWQISRRNQIPRSIIFQPKKKKKKKKICSVQLGMMALVSNPSKYGRVMNSRLS